MSALCCVKVALGSPRALMQKEGLCRILPSAHPAVAVSAAPGQSGTNTRHSPTWQNLHLIYNIVKVTGKKLNRSVKRPITYYTSVQMSVQSPSMFLSPPGQLWPLSSEIIRAGSESGRRRALKNNEQ